MTPPQSPSRAFASLSLNPGPSKHAPEPTSAQGDAAIDELERFRREWRQEVQAKHTHPPDRKPLSPETSPKASKAPLARSPVRRTAPIDMDDMDERAPLLPHSAGSVATPAPAGPGPTSTSRKIPFPAPYGPRKDREAAIQLYARAVEKEQAGQLNDALMFYRKAFKMDDNVDRLYARAAKAAPISTEAEDTPSSTDIVSPSAPQEQPYSFQRHIQVQPDYERSIPLHAATKSTHQTSPLTALFQSLPVAPFELAFQPEDESLPVPIARLPAELMDPILSHLDVASVERFALTCWRARHLTSVSAVWRAAVEGIYKPPAMVPDGWQARDLVRRHAGEWRTTLIDEERVRLDGCYISICHYIRPGAGDQWVTITHMITYHRFLRFYPDGFVMSFLTTDHPSEIVPALRPSLRAKGLHFGRWRLLRSDADPDGDANVETKGKDGRRATILITDLLEPGLESPKYEFEMELTLRETSRGRWNKLDLATYRSINLANGEALELSLKHQKPFYFSKVRSYHPAL